MTWVHYVFYFNISHGMINILMKTFYAFICIFIQDILCQLPSKQNIAHTSKMKEECLYTVWKDATKWNFSQSNMWLMTTFQTLKWLSGGHFEKKSKFKKTYIDLLTNLKYVCNIKKIGQWHLGDIGMTVLVINGNKMDKIAIKAAILIKIKISKRRASTSGHTPTTCVISKRSVYDI